MPPPPRKMPEPSELTRNSILRISEDKTVELIQEWERWECLWNTNLEDYPNKSERNAATKAIAEKLNIPHFKAEHVAIKFKNLRNSYCQELKKMSTNTTYKPRVLWFGHMDKFLRPHLQTWKPYAGMEQAQDNITFNSVKTEIDSDDNILYTEDWAVATSSQSDASCSNSLLIESTYSERCPSENGESSNHYQAKKRKHSVESKRKLKEVDNEENKKNEELETEMPKEKKVKKVNKPDYCDTFGTYVASLLRSLPKKKALILQPKIVNMIVSVGIEDQSDEDSDS